MRVPGRYAHARHILVGSKSQAQAILDEITSARKPLKVFKKMARDYSTCTTSEQKGDLGEFHEKQMVPEFSEQVWKQELESCDCFIKSRFGFHLIWVHSRDEQSFTFIIRIILAFIHNIYFLRNYRKKNCQVSWYGKQCGVRY